MDPPYIHQTRYVPISSPPPPPAANHTLFRPSIYHQQPTFLPSPTPHRPQPPPPPPQPPPPQIIPPPPPAPPPQTQQLHHHHPSLPSQLVPPQKLSYNPPFTFNPNFNPNPNSKPHNQFHERSSDFVRRIHIDDDRQHQQQQHRQRLLADFDARSGRWDPPRNVSDHRPLVANLEHRHQFDHRPMSPYRSVNSKIKHELDASSYRFRERHKNDGFEFEYNTSSSSNQRAEFVPHRSHFVPDSDRLNSSNYDSQHSSQFASNALVRNNVRIGVFDRAAMRERESVIERGSNSGNISDGVRGFIGKREFYGLDSGRYGNNRGSRENSYEYNRTPRKPVQKKSALLRIQKPSYRHRDEEELHYSGYEMKSGSFRGKEQVLFSDREVGEEEEERETSPVELDVSFKSNSLVAKAIMAPSSSAVVSDANLTPKKGNARKIMVSNKDRSRSQMNKASDSGVKLDSGRVVVNNVTSSDNGDLKPSEKEVAPSGVNMGDIKSRPCSTGNSNSLAKIPVEMSKDIVPDKSGTGVHAGKTSPFKVAKKKKVVKKVVKKAMNPTLPVSSSQPIKKLGESRKGEGSTLNAPAAPLQKMGVKPSKEKITSAMPSGHLVDFQPYPNDKNILAGNDKVSGSPEAAMVLKEVSTDNDSCVSSVPKIKRKRTGSISPLASSSRKETKIDEDAVNADNCSHALHSVSNSDKNPTKSLNENTGFDISTAEGAGMQFRHNRSSLLLDDSATKEFSEILFSARRNINSDLLSLEENKKLGSLVKTSSVAHGMNTAMRFNNGSVGSQEKITNSEVGIINASNKQPCKDQMGTSVNASIYADCSNHGKCSVLASDNVNIINTKEINIGTGDYNGKQLAPNDVAVSLGNVVTEGFPSSFFSVGSSEGDMLNTTNKSKVMTPLSDFPDATITDMSMEPVKAVGPAQSVDTILNLSTKVCSPAEVRVTSSLEIGLQSCSDGSGVLNGGDLAGRCEAKVSDSSILLGTSPERRKRRKVSACHPGFSSMVASESSEGPLTPDLSTSGVELPSISTDGQIQIEEGVAVSNVDTLGALPPCPDGISFLYENSLAGVSSEVAVSVSRDASRVGDDCLKVEHPRATSCSAFGELEISNAQSCCLPGSESRQIVNENPVIDGSNSNEVMCMDDSKTERIEAVVAEEQVKACSEATQFETPSEYQSADLSQVLPTYVEFDGCPLEKGDLPSVSSYPALAADGDGVSTNSNDEMMEFDSPSNMYSPEILSNVAAMQMLNHESSSQISNENACEIDKLPTEKPVLEANSNLSANTSPSEHAKINLKSDCIVESSRLVVRRTTVSPSHDVKSTGHNLTLTSGETYGKKNQSSHTISRIHPSCSSSVFSASRNTTSSTRIRKPRTWHRTESSSASPMPGNKSSLCTVPQQSQLPKNVAKFQSMSYIRKGNSLVRKPAPVAALPQVSHGSTSSVYRLNSSGIGEAKKTAGSDSSADVVDPSNFSRMGGVNAPFERPRTPPLPAVAKVPNRTTNLAVDCTTSPLAEPLPNGCFETTSDPQKSMEINNELSASSAPLKISETPVKQTGLVNSSEIQGEPNDGTLGTANEKRITYVKRKSNQLIAASGDCALSVQNPDKTQGLTSEGYYKRRKNQLIRTSFESHINPTVTSVDGAMTSEGEKASNDIFSRSFVGKKIRKPLKFSLVWTLNGLQSSKDGDHSSYRRKVLPYLFPWKRAAYWRRFMQDSISLSNNSSLSAIGHKLLLLRKRDTIYTRSNHGFSLRKSKVLSVGGSSLKWSKSIENRSKKANEEATLAVAAVEKKKQQNGVESFASETKNRSHSSKSRIFRIGSVRYKMDSSRRTLQRISDDGSSCTAAPNSEKNVKKSYIPRRLVIGNDEYVRIGNGNQLIRDPKKRARVLASEKVRWSLHTARLRLAKKRKYCQFFTRFGKCNKDDGKCPYIHDPSKIAVCTKFLNGLCSNSNCKLTHKIIPERMPDCSYFLQGLCTNKNCPYRHVHVNPNASTCEGFLKGYCADGNEIWSVSCSVLREKDGPGHPCIAS